MRFKSTAGIALLLLGANLLAACTGPGLTRTVRGGGSQPAEFARNYLQYAGREGPVLMTVQGEAFGQPGAMLAPRLAEATSGAVFGLPVTFTTNREAVREPNWRIVFLIDNAPGASDQAVCAGEAPQSPVPETDNILAVFCFRERPYASVSGYSRSFGGPDDPALRDLARQIVRDMFPNAQEEQMREYDD
ncbi:MAG: hypothetical protein KKB63_03480 [Alphaproteobacteria bacterium]|nr:hypothetical protein [Alphaproteobacteria bacterium]